MIYFDWLIPEPEEGNPDAGAAPGTVVLAIKFPAPVPAAKVNVTGV